MLTDSAFQQIMPTLPEAKRQLYLPFINKVMEIYEINTTLRAAAFLASDHAVAVTAAGMNLTCGQVPTR